MIKKSFLVLAFTAIFALSAQAQLPFIDFGVKVGINNLDHKFNSNSAITDGLNTYGFKTDDKVGWHIGGQARINLMMFHIQPEILFSHNAYDMDLAHLASTGISSTKVKVNSIDVPLLFGVKMLIFRVQVGPMFTIMTDAKTSGGLVNDVSMSKPAASYLIGVGADLSRFTVDVRYNGHFSRTRQTFTVDGVNTASTHHSRDKGLTFSLGYLF